MYIFSLLRRRSLSLSRVSPPQTSAQPSCHFRSPAVCLCFEETNQHPSMELDRRGSRFTSKAYTTINFRDICTFAVLYSFPTYTNYLFLKGTICCISSRRLKLNRAASLWPRVCLFPVCKFWQSVICFVFCLSSLFWLISV